MFLNLILPRFLNGLSTGDSRTGVIAISPTLLPASIILLLILSVRSWTSPKLTNGAALKSVEGSKAKHSIHSGSNSNIIEKSFIPLIFSTSTSTYIPEASMYGSENPKRDVVSTGELGLTGLFEPPEHPINRTIKNRTIEYLIKQTPYEKIGY